MFTRGIARRTARRTTRRTITGLVIGGVALYVLSNLARRARQARIGKGQSSFQ